MTITAISFDNDKQRDLFQFVVSQHGDQKRKYTDEPYWIHLINVAFLVKKYLPQSTLGIEASLCHDLFEDTTCTASILASECINIGYSKHDVHFIVQYVTWLTDQYTSKAYPRLNRYHRKINEGIRLSKSPSIIQSIKYADLIDNTSSIVEHDKGFAKVYLSEKKELLDRLRNGNIDLYIMACASYYNSIEKINENNAILS